MIEARFGGMNRLTALALAAAVLATPAFAQVSDTQSDSAEKEPRRVRVGLGAQVTPNYPGSDKVNLRPFWDVSLARGSEPFAYEAADESFGVPIIRTRQFEIGPAVAIEGSRRKSETGPGIDEVGLTIEAGAFADVWFSDSVRLHVEGRKGINGHRALIGEAGVDYVARDGDNWLFAIGPRIAASDGKYQRTYFGVTPTESAATGIAAYRPGGGIHSAGATASFQYQFTPTWGIMSYAKFDRLVGDAERSPLVRERGSKNQLSGGLALTYTFGGNR